MWKTEMNEYGKVQMRNFGMKFLYGLTPRGKYIYLLKIWDFLEFFTGYILFMTKLTISGGFYGIITFGNPRALTG